MSEQRTNYSPYESGGTYSWWLACVSVPPHCHLPPAVFHRLPHCAASHEYARYYPTREAAVEALRLARERAQS